MTLTISWSRPLATVLFPGLPPLRCLSLEFLESEVSSLRCRLGLLTPQIIKSMTRLVVHRFDPCVVVFRCRTGGVIFIVWDITQHHSLCGSLASVFSGEQNGCCGAHLTLHWSSDWGTSCYWAYEACSRLASQRNHRHPKSQGSLNPTTFPNYRIIHINPTFNPIFAVASL